MLKHALVALALMFTAAPAMAKKIAKPVKVAKAIKAEAPIMVDLNTAAADRLVTLPGVGAVKAKAIIAYRTAQKFKTLADATNVKGIGAKTVAKWVGKAVVLTDGVIGIKKPAKLIKKVNKVKKKVKKKLKKKL